VKILRVFAEIKVEAKLLKLSKISHIYKVLYKICKWIFRG